MSTDWLPGPLFNPLTGGPLTPWQALAGPGGLLLFLPLAPLVRLAARRAPHAALLSAAVLWLLATQGPLATLVLMAWLAVGVAWLQALAATRHAGRISRRGMLASVWIGLHLLALPLWWHGRQFWYPSPMAALHSAGFGYLLLRLIAWGHELAEDPRAGGDWSATSCWLLYPPGLRLAPFVLRHEFAPALARWQPSVPVAWRSVWPRLGWLLLGGAGLGFTGNQLDRIVRSYGDFLADATPLPTDRLLLVFYLIPLQVYLLLWTYNQLAQIVANIIGIPVPDNFNRLPLATSVRDFWRRWNLTVGNWLRTYLYIPLGGNRQHVTLNYVLVFGYCGLWHGAAWSFVWWGLSQGAALSVQRGWDHLRARLGPRAPRGRVWTVACWLLTMHYQAATIVVFADFQYAGTRVLGELGRRLIGLALPA
ncbi:MAG: hypothetical protein IPM18_03455 [Phycisphaerales bacterium]|nr:hypothetical protein [Phycisphaerales bacterium]